MITDLSLCHFLTRYISVVIPVLIKLFFLSFQIDYRFILVSLFLTRYISEVIPILIKLFFLNFQIDYRFILMSLFDTSYFCGHSGFNKIFLLKILKLITDLFLRYFLTRYISVVVLVLIKLFRLNFKTLMDLFLRYFLTHYISVDH